MTPRAGDVLHLTRAASVQFVEPILFRVIRVLDYVTYDGWMWIEGYQLDLVTRDAVLRRELFVQTAGIRFVRAPVPPSPKAKRVPPARIPRVRPVDQRLI